jgi:ABC-type multidrug transport system fused ATPase/permease subunit
VFFIDFRNVQNNYLEGSLGFISQVANSTYTFSPQRTVPFRLSFTWILSIIVIVIFILVAVVMGIAARKLRQRELAYNTDLNLPSDNLSIHTTSTLGMPEEVCIVSLPLESDKQIVQ